MTSALRRHLVAPRVQVLLLAGSTYANLLLGLVTGPLVARALGPTGRGEIAAVQVYAILAATLLAFGISSAVLHAVRQRPGAQAEILGMVLRYSLWLIPLSACLAAAVSQLVVVDLHGAVRLWCFVLVAAAPVSVVSLVLVSFLLARGALSSVAMLRACPTVLVALMVVILAVTGDLTVANYLALVFVVTILAAVLGFVAVRIRPRRGGRLRPLLAFGGRAWIGSLANMGNIGLDQALIAPFLGAAELGYYAIAATLSLLPLGLATAVGSRIWGDVNIGSDEGVDLERTGLHVRLAIACATWAALGLMLVAPFGIPLLYGDAFHTSVLPFLLLLPGTIAFSGAWVLEAALVLAGRPGANSRAELTALLCTVIGLAAFLPVIGIVGAAITTSVAYTVRFSVQIRVLRRIGTLEWRPHAKDMRYIASQALGLLVRGLRSRAGP